MNPIEINKRYTVTLKEDEEGDLILPIPDEILLALGWSEGDTLSMEIRDGSLILKKTGE